MEGLTEGRIVHYILPSGRHRAAIVVDVENKERGICTLFVMSVPRDGFDGFFIRTSANYSEESLSETWHWIEKA